MLCALSLLTLAATAASAAPGPGASAKSEAYYYFSLGIRARMARDERGALEDLRKAQRADPGSGAIRAEIARLMRDTGRLTEALAEAQAAVRTEPKNVEAQLVLAQTYYLAAASGTGEASEGMLDKAAEAYEEAVKLDPRDDDALSVLAEIYTRRQAHEKAVSAWTRYLALNPGSAEGYMHLGQQYLAENKGADATGAFERALALKPSAEACERLAGIFAQANETDDAVKYYRKAIELGPNNVRTRLILSETLLRARRFKECVAEADEVLKLDPKNRYARSLKVQALRDSHDLSAAEALLDTWIKEDPRDLDTGFLKATILEARHEWPEAAKTLEAALARPRQNEDAEQGRRNDQRLWLHLGVVRQELGLYAQAATAVAQARALDSEPTSELFAWEIQALMRAKDLEAAATRVREGRAQFPQATDLIALDATIRREQGRESEAEAIINKLRADGDKDKDTLLEVAGYYRRARRYSDAEGVLRRAYELAPQDTDVLFQLGGALEREQRFDQAETMFREALAVKPDAAPILNYLGYMNANRGVRLEESLELIQRALTLDPANGAYLDSFGWANFRLGRLDVAEKSIRQSLASMERNAVVLDHLGDVLKRLGRTQEAVRYWALALKGEDEDQELDRAAVDAKIQAAEASLAHANTPR
jgi:tetratricopeptide (TPR) repeat protein